MNDLQLWDGLIGALIGAAVGAVPAWLMWGRAGTANKQTAAATKQAAEANRISEAALEEARLARKIQHDEWHRQATPAISVELGALGDDGGYELKFRCEQDIDSGRIELVPGYDPAVVIGLGADPDEQVFVFGTAVELGNLTAGQTTIKGIWTGLPEKVEGKTVQLRCTVTIGADSWPIIREVTFPVTARIVAPSEGRHVPGR